MDIGQCVQPVLYSTTIFYEMDTIKEKAR